MMARSAGWATAQAAMQVRATSRSRLTEVLSWHRLSVRGRGVGARKAIDAEALLDAFRAAGPLSCGAGTSAAMPQMWPRCLCAAIIASNAMIRGGGNHTSRVGELRLPGNARSAAGAPRGPGRALLPERPERLPGQAAYVRRVAGEADRRQSTSPGCGTTRPATARCPNPRSSPPRSWPTCGRRWRRWRGFELVRPEGFEPPTPGLGILCSILLSYGRSDRVAAAFRRFLRLPGGSSGTPVVANDAPRAQAALCQPQISFPGNGRRSSTGQWQRSPSRRSA
jgi:hypothetical protein